MNTDTPRTDEWETYCDECYYHMWRVRRKNERGFDDGFHVQNGEGARQLVDLLNKQDEELTAARADAEDIRDMYYGLLEDHENLVKQRDRLAELLSSLLPYMNPLIANDAHNQAQSILQSLTTKDHE